LLVCGGRTKHEMPQESRGHEVTRSRDTRVHVEFWSWIVGRGETDSRKKF